MSDRGMKKWAPYSSLIEQATALQEMMYEKNKKEMPTLSVDQKEKINFILSNYHGQILSIKFWHNGYLYKLTKPIKRIDTSNRLLVFDNGKLSFNQIVEITDTEEY